MVLDMEKITYVLDQFVPMKLPERYGEEKCVVWEELHDHDLRDRNCILTSMNNELQRQHEHMGTAAKILNLKELYGEQSRTT